MSTITKFPTANSGGTYPWTSPGNLYADDNTYASVANPFNVYNRDYIQFLSTYAFGVPVGAIINSVTVTAGWYGGSVDETFDLGIQAYLGTSTARGAETTVSATQGSEVVLTLANPGTWSVAELNTNTTAGMNIRLRYRKTSDNGYAQSIFCDYIKVVIDYSLGYAHKVLGILTPAKVNGAIPAKVLGV